MALLGWPELVLIFVILIFLFGATRIKDLAKAVGEGVREFKRASEESPKEKENLDESIIDTAKKMGIKTEGKDIKQILKEMEEKETERKA